MMNDTAITGPSNNPIDLDDYAVLNEPLVPALGKMAIEDNDGKTKCVDIIISEKTKILQVRIGRRCRNAGEVGGGTAHNVATETHDDTTVATETEVGSEAIDCKGKSDVLDTR